MIGSSVLNRFEGFLWEVRAVSGGGNHGKAAVHDDMIKATVHDDATEILQICPCETVVCGDEKTSVVDSSDYENRRQGVQ